MIIDIDITSSKSTTKIKNVNIKYSIVENIKIICHLLSPPGYIKFVEVTPIKYISFNIIYNQICKV